MPTSSPVTTSGLRRVGDHGGGVRFHRTGLEKMHQPAVGQLDLTYEGMELPADPRTHALRPDRRTLFRDSEPAQTLCRLGRNRGSRRDRGGARVGWQQMNFIDALAKESCCRLSPPRFTAESV